ncbi:helix-turn-helix domain-containing protein [Halodesulfovibrio aestuarii]|uniref:Helix-turn-helix domain-containing protein n=1 Tax=Halodesulfovibrio aestuarii TaxID=126333 RepID=A0ABV4JUD0_9BACT
MEQRNLIPEFIADLTRTEKLEVYMKRKKLTFSDIGKAIGVSRAAAHKLLFGKSVPTYRHAQLVAAGIPEVLIPSARDIAPGPKPKAAVESIEPNYLGQAA